MSTVWSCGGGVQSAAIAALIVSGDIPKPDAAVMSDTGREKSATWRYFDSVLVPKLASVGVELIRLDHEKWSTVDIYGGADGKRAPLMPMFTDRNGQVGQKNKYCSNEWKVRPVDRYIRSLGLESGERWIGFSIDEFQRCRGFDPRAKWNQRYHLIERRMTRIDCQVLVESVGWPAAPRSACWMCPYQNDVEWKETKSKDQGDFVMARDLEREIQVVDPDLYFHRSCTTLDRADFNESQGELLDQCGSGMCFT